MPKVTTDAMDELWQDFSKGVIDMDWDVESGVLHIAPEEESDPLGYELIDCVQLEKQWPESFSTPSVVEISRIQPNDFVKLFFRDPLVEGFPERLWVQVSFYNLNYGGMGRIANVPYCVPAMYGDVVHFQRYNILEIMKREVFNAKGGLQVPRVVQATRQLALLPAPIED